MLSHMLSHKVTLEQAQLLAVKTFYTGLDRIYILRDGSAYYHGSSNYPLNSPVTGFNSSPSSLTWVQFKSCL